MKHRVLVACHAGDGWVRKEIATTLGKLGQGGRFEVGVEIVQRRPYVNALHHTIRDFLEGDWDYLLNVDDDNPPPTDVLNLVDLGLDVVGAPTPIWHPLSDGEPPIFFNAMRDLGEIGFQPLAFKECRGLVEVDAVGTGCVLIARRVLEQVQAPFHRTWNEDGTTNVGNDFAACRRWKEAGFRVWAHFGYVCRHFCELDLLEVLGYLMGRPGPKAEPK